MKIAYAARRVHTGTVFLPDHAVLVDRGIVKGIVPAIEIPSAYETGSAMTSVIAPGLIDMQLYGGNGKLFSQDLDVASLEATRNYCLAGGCTHFMITLATNSMDVFYRAFEAARAYRAAGGKGLLGVHLEGPYINPEKRGAHIAGFIRKPTAAEIDELLKKGEGIFRMMTLAPEQCDPALVKKLIDAGIIVSAGHSNATFGQAVAGFEAGIPTVTHFFNAMSPLQGRAPGMVGAVYANPDVMSSIICDGVHVHFAAVNITKKILGDRLFFITDAVTDTPGGAYTHVFAGDRYTLPDGTLSGSCITMLGTLRNAVRHAGISLEEAIRMGCAYPARLLGDPRLGHIVPDAPADFIAFDEDFSLRKLVAHGVTEDFPAPAAAT